MTSSILGSSDSIRNKQILSSVRKKKGLRNSEIKELLTWDFSQTFEESCLKQIARATTPDLREVDNKAFQA